MVKLYTAQYRYSEEDRLDITVKGKDPIGRVFAPTWGMVMEYKDNNKYITAYHNYMISSYRRYRNIWDEILSRDVVTFVCFCKPFSFCHRYLLAEYFSKLGAEYIGEREL